MDRNLKRNYRDFTQHPYMLIRDMMFLDECVSQGKFCADILYQNDRIDEEEYKEINTLLINMNRHDSNHNVKLAVEWLGQYCE